MNESRDQSPDRSGPAKGRRRGSLTRNPVDRVPSESSVEPDAPPVAHGNPAASTNAKGKLGSDEPDLAGNRERAIDRSSMLLEAIGNGDVDHFVEHFDRSVICDLSLNQSQRGTVSQWVDKHFSQTASVGLASYRLGALGCLRPYQRYHFRWTWPLPRFSNECVLAIVKDPSTVDFGPDEALERVLANAHDPVWANVFTRDEQIRAGEFPAVDTKEEWGGFHVLVWAIIDVGFTRSSVSKRFHSDYVMLDRLPCRPPHRPFFRNLQNRSAGRRRQKS